MCNLYSQTKDRMTVMMRFKLNDNRTAWFEPKDAIFPANEAPVIKIGSDGERELEIMNWVLYGDHPNGHHLVWET